VAGVLLAILAAEAAAQRRPLAFAQPTSIELEPAGTLLVVENNPGRLLRVDPRSGRVAAVVRVARPYAVVRTSAGRVYFSAGNALRRVDGSRPPATVARADAEIGPVAAAPDGTLYFATNSHVYRVVPGSSAPVVLAPSESLEAPHGLAIARDGSLLVSDTGHDRIVRVDPATGEASTFAVVRGPRGLDVARDGTVAVVDSGANRVLRLLPSGTRLGYLSRTSGDLYDVQPAPGGVTYVLEAGASGRVRRISPAGAVATLSR
jgi:streptogramin lyase